MKLVIAFIRPEKLQDVRQALHQVQIPKYSVTMVQGTGLQPGHREAYRGIEYEVILHARTRIECAVNDDYLDRCINAICGAAGTEQVGDGKILVLDLLDCIRIRTGEHGSKAIG